MFLCLHVFILNMRLIWREKNHWFFFSKFKKNFYFQKIGILIIFWHWIFINFFLQGGVLVAVVRGANSPKILRTITEQLQQEHKVIDGQSERKEVRPKDRGEDLRIKEGVELVCDWKGGCKKSADGKICKQIQQKMIVHVVVKAMTGEIFKNWFCIN